MIGLGDIVDAAGDAVGAIGDAAEDAFEAGVDALEDVVEDVVDVAEDAIDSLGDMAEDVLDSLGDLAEDALDGADDVFDAFADLAEEAWDESTDFIEDAVDSIADAAEDAWQEIADAAEDAWQDIADAAEDAWQAIEDSVEDLWEDTIDAAERVWEGVAEAAEWVYEAAASTYEWALDAIERTLTWLGELIKDIAYAIAMLGACLAGMIIHDLAEGDNIVLNFGRSVKKLSSSFKDEVRDLFPDVALNRVWYMENASLSANHFSDDTDGMTFMNPTISGVDLGYMIYLAGTFDESVKNDRGLMVHELVHVEQYRQFRFEDAFACSYGIGFADAGFSYDENPLEAQAFEVQRAYLA